MKILHILNELRLSGTEVMLYAAAPYWQHEGVELHILHKGKIRGPFAPYLEEAGYILHHIPFGNPLQFLLQYSGLLRRGRFDVVQIHTEHANFWIALLARCLLVDRTVRTIHGIFHFRGILRLERRIQRKMLSAMGIPHISVGESVYISERRHFRNPSQIIPNWYNSSRLHPVNPDDRLHARRHWGVGDADFVIVTVGNCSPTKNHTALLDALVLIPPSFSFCYLHAGEECGDEERKYAGKTGISSRVHFLGPVIDTTTLYQAADVFIMPSLREGFGIAALEAMGAGVPVILSDVPGLRDFRTVSDDIVWVQPDGPSLARGLLVLAKMNPQQRLELGLRLSNMVKERFGIEAGAHAYLKLWTQ